MLLDFNGKSHIIWEVKNWIKREFWIIYINFSNSIYDILKIKNKLFINNHSTFSKNVLFEKM